MDYNEFKGLYVEHAEHSMIAAIVGTSIGYIGAACMFFFTEYTYGALGFLGLGLLGTFAIYKNIVHKKGIDELHNPLLKALEENDSEYIKWFYITEVKREIAPRTVRYDINLYNEKKAMAILTLDDKDQADRAMQFLASRFPNAEKGYTEDIEQEMKVKYGYK